MIIEHVYADGVVTWAREGQRGLAGVAVKSPLTGAWLAQDATGSTRRERLTGARAWVLGGNGRRYGGHTTVDRVVYH